MLSLAVLLSACSTGPGCTDDAARSAVIVEARDLFKRQFAEAGAPPAVVDSLKFDLVGIKTTGKDPMTGAPTCSAELALTGPSETKKMPIWYSVEKSGSGVKVNMRLGG